MPSPGTLMVQEGSKIWLFLGQNLMIMKGLLRVGPFHQESVLCVISYSNPAVEPESLLSASSVHGLDQESWHSQAPGSFERRLLV